MSESPRVTDERKRFDVLDTLTLIEVQEVVSCMCRECHHDIVHQTPGPRTIAKTALTALAELERLCGPVCPHDGERASEHYQGGSDDCMAGDPPCGFPEEWWCHLTSSELDDTHRFEPNTHPAWPEGEQWLHERSRR